MENNSIGPTPTPSTPSPSPGGIPPPVKKSVSSGHSYTTTPEDAAVPQELIKQLSPETGKPGSNQPITATPSQETPPKITQIKNSVLLKQQAPPPTPPSPLPVVLPPDPKLVALKNSLSAKNELYDNAKVLTLFNLWQTQSASKKLPKTLTSKELQVVFDNFLVNENIKAHPEYSTTLFSLTERLAQAYINEKNSLVAQQVRMLAATYTKTANTLQNLSSTIEKSSSFGVHFSSLDSSLLKNSSLWMQKRTRGVDPDKGKNYLQIEGELHHHARSNLDTTLSWAQAKPQEFHQSLPQNFCKSINISEVNDGYFGKLPDGTFSNTGAMAGRALSIYFEGVGKIQIGINKDHHCNYNRISIELDPNVKMEDVAKNLQIIFASLGLGALATEQRAADQERMKIFQLFRIFYPKEAHAFERTETSFTIPTKALKTAMVRYLIHSKSKEIDATKPKSEILKNAQLMGQKLQERFNKYLDDSPHLMYQQELEPGYKVWAVKGLSDTLRKVNAVGLMAGVGNGGQLAQACNTAAALLKGGFKSTQRRYQAGLIGAGGSPAKDLKVGGGNSVFTRMITKSLLNEPVGKFTFNGHIQVLLTLDALERGGYAYASDLYGTKVAPNYSERSNFITLAKLYEENQGKPIPEDLEDTEFIDNFNYTDNEVCLKNSIPPQYIKGLMVVSEDAKKKLIEALEANQLIAKIGDIKNVILTYEENGIKLNKHIPVDAFIRVGTKFEERYWQ